MSSIATMTPSEFCARWPAGNDADDVILLDVREPHELALAAIDRALHIPMMQVPERMQELDGEKTIVVMCHGGVRSMRVAAFLAEHSFEKVINLEGGIDAWSREVDDSVPRY